MLRLLNTLFAMVYAMALFSQPISEFIHVDQFGYLPEADKVAVISDPQVGYNSTLSYQPIANLQVIDVNSGNVVFSGQAIPWNNGATHDQSGDRGFWFDFSTLKTPGTYYISDPTSNEISATFEIQEGVYSEILKAAGRMYYYNRCGMAKAAPFAESKWTDSDNFSQDANCQFIYDQGNVALEKDLTGGWFDAGDYNKYVTFATTTVSNLLWAYTENPDAFTDNWNIPESGNGIPDIIDEVKYELDWLYKMTNADGTVHIKMGSKNFSENAAAPPSANNDPRYYGPTCTSASIAIVNMFGQAALTLKGLDGLSTYGASLQARAEDCWSYVLPLINSNQLETECDDGSIVAGDADQNVETQIKFAIAGAIYLFALTGEQNYSDFVANNVASIPQFEFGDWNAYDMYLQDALMLYTTLQGANSTLSADILSSITNASRNNWNGYFGFNEADLYRAFMPDWSYHWGSNSPKAAYGGLNMMLNQYNINTDLAASFEKAALGIVHYFHGVNPQGLVYLSNMYPYGADRGINEIYHTWFADGSEWDHALTSTKGPAPGYVTGGPNASFSVGSLTPPSGQPLQKSYLDFNDSWPNNSWEITEPAIYYQAAYVRLLTHFVKNTITTSSDSGNDFLEAQINLFPNPAKDYFTLTGIPQEVQIDVFDSTGKHIHTITNSGETSLLIDLNNFANGAYWIKVMDGSDGNFVVKKIIKS